MTETQEGVTMPADYSFAAVNDYVHGVDRHYEELQWLGLSMATHIEKIEKTAAYYKAGMLKTAPEFVPSRVNVLREQFGDAPFRGAGVAAGEHDCKSNKWGAVSVLARDGKPLGLRLDEFEPLAWRKNETPNEVRGAAK